MIRPVDLRDCSRRSLELMAETLSADIAEEENRSIADESDNVDCDGHPVDQPRQPSQKQILLGRVLAQLPHAPEYDIDHNPRHRH